MFTWIAFVGGIPFFAYCLFVQRAVRVRGLLARAEFERARTTTLLGQAEADTLEGRVDPAMLQRSLQALQAAYASQRAQAEVIEFNSRPGMGIRGEGVHSHPAHLTVVLSDKARARVKHDGKTFIGENKLGDVFWSEAETHEVENISGRNVRALIVELKGKA